MSDIYKGEDREGIYIVFPRILYSVTINLISTRNKGEN